MSRAVPEWIGRTDNSKVPDRVRIRVFEREGGVCHLSGLPIDKVRDEWDLDHKVALILGGQHRESNLFPALREPHRKKTAVEMGVKAKIARVKKKHMGLGKSKVGGFSGPFKRKINGDVIDTRTGEVISR
jgi:5-methylcytosine-specific restriction protein A